MLFIEPKPFHEVILQEIKRGGSVARILGLMKMIEATEVTAKHDEIIAAIDNFFDFLGAGKYSGTIKEVKKSLRAQQEKAQIRVFTWRENPASNKETACFIDRGIHAPYIIGSYSAENYYIKEVGEPTKCDGLCYHALGGLENWSNGKSKYGINVKSIIEKAFTFAAQQ